MLDGSGYATTLSGTDELNKVPNAPSGLTARTNTHTVPVAPKVHDAVASPATLSGAEAHITDGEGSVGFVDAYTTTFPLALVSCPVVVIETDVCDVTYTVPAVYVKLAGLAYCVGRAVVAISRLAPLTLKNRRAVR
jgi:hypothetical protein